MEYIGVKKMKKKSYPKLYEYRIKYNATEEIIANDSYHYFMAEDAKIAFEAHTKMLQKKNIKVQNISIEKHNPYSGKWEDESLNLINKESD